MAPMKLKAKLTYVRDHDLQQGPEGIQKILHFQTEGGGDARFTLLVHTGEHEGHPTPTVDVPRGDGEGQMDDKAVGELMAAGKAKTFVANSHMPEPQHVQMVRVVGDEGKEFEITITPL